MRKKKMAILLTTLIGLFVPTGNVWGPYIVSINDDPLLKKYRFRVAIYGICVLILGFASGVVCWLKQIDNLSNQQGLHSSWVSIPLYVWGGLMLLLPVVGIILLMFRKESA